MEARKKGRVDKSGERERGMERGGRYISGERKRKEERGGGINQGKGKNK